MLWLTEVEGVVTKDAATHLGLSANGAAQLAVRARTGLRERFLQAHLRDATDAACRFSVDRLGAHVEGGLSLKDQAKLDQHLADCTPCADRREQLADLGASLRRIALPMPVALGAASAGTVNAGLVATTTAAPVLAAGTGPAARALAWTHTPPTWFQRAVAASSAAVLAVGVASLGFQGVEDGGTETATHRITPAAAALPAPVAIDLAGRVAPVALSSADTISTALRSAATPPDRSTSVSAGNRRERVAGSAPSGSTGSVAATPAPGSPVTPPAAPASPLPVPLPTPDSPVPLPTGPLPTVPPLPNPSDGGGGEEEEAPADPGPAPITAVTDVVNDVADAIGASAEATPLAPAVDAVTALGL